MKKLFSLIALGQALSAGSSYAIQAGATDNQEGQQTKVAACNSGAKDMKGNDRKAYIRSCLSIDGRPPRQTKLTICNVEAKGLQGDQRQIFMSSCLKE